MKYSREYILKRAFDVFITRGYDSTSITVLQQELKMSRGAMYRYFKNKEDLFFAVIDRYFFRLYSKILQGMDKDFTVLELIDEIYRRQQLVAKAFNKAGITHTVFLNYTALIIQAAKYYPDFIVQFTEIQNRFISRWKNALIKSVEKKEIKEDIDINMMCMLFNAACTRESSECDHKRIHDHTHEFAKSILKDLEKRRDVMLYLYNLIKA